MRYFLYFIWVIAALVVIYLLGLLFMIYKTYPLTDDFGSLSWFSYLLIIISLLPAVLALMNSVPLLLIEFGYKKERAGGIWSNISKKPRKQKRWSNVMANLMIGFAIYFSYHVFSTISGSEAFSEILNGEQNQLLWWVAGLAIAVVLGLFMSITNRWMVWRYWRRREQVST